MLFSKETKTKALQKTRGSTTKQSKQTKIKAKSQSKELIKPIKQSTQSKEQNKIKIKQNNINDK